MMRGDEKPKVLGAAKPFSSHHILTEQVYIDPELCMIKSDYRSELDNNAHLLNAEPQTAQETCSASMKPVFYLFLVH